MASYYQSCDWPGRRGPHTTTILVLDATHCTSMGCILHPWPARHCSSWRLAVNQPGGETAGDEPPKGSLCDIFCASHCPVFPTWVGEILTPPTRPISSRQQPVAVSRVGLRTQSYSPKCILYLGLRWRLKRRRLSGLGLALALSPTLLALLVPQNGENRLESSNRPSHE